MASRLTSLVLPFFLATFALAQLYQDSVNIKNTPKSSNKNTTTLQQLRDYWCNMTTVRDRNYNASRIYYYREARSNILNKRLDGVVDYINNGNAINAIQTIRWPFGLALTLLLVIFIAWIVFMAFICCGKKNTSVTGGLIFGLSCVKLALFVFSSLFVMIMILIALSEVSIRRSKCQFLNVGNMILNGYYSALSGTQYAGLVAMQEAVANFRNDVANTATVKNQATDILNANFLGLASTNLQSLRSVANSFADSQTSNAFGQSATPKSVAGFNAWINDSIRREFTDFNSLAQSVQQAGDGVFNLIQASQSPSQSGVMTQTLTSLGTFFQNITGDVYSAANSVHTTIRWTWVFATGGYWALFAVTILLLILAGILSSGLTTISVSENRSRDYKFYKVLLAVFGFLMVWYAILLIILLAGSGFISSFCSLLASVNSGNARVLDRLNFQWPGNTRQIAKECLAGKTGNLWNFASLSTEAINPAYASNVQGVIRGILNHRAFYFNPEVLSSSSIAWTIANYRSIQAGIQYDHTGVDEQWSFVKNSYPSFSTAASPSLTTWLCNEYQVSLRPSCVALDTPSALSAFGSRATYPNNTVVQNLFNYVQSENALLNNLIQSLDGNTNVLTPAQAFRNAKLVLDARKPSMDAIASTFASSVAPFSQYDVQATYLFDCRSVKKELAILEDHYCFELNYWVYIILVLSAISMVMLFIIGWSFMGVICELDTNDSPVSIPAREIGADINEREIAPRA